MSASGAAWGQDRTRTRELGKHFSTPFSTPFSIFSFLFHLVDTHPHHHHSISLSGTRVLQSLIQTNIYPIFLCRRVPLNRQNKFPRAPPLVPPQPVVQPLPPGSARQTPPLHPKTESLQPCQDDGGVAAACRGPAPPGGSHHPAGGRELPGLRRVRHSAAAGPCPAAAAATAATDAAPNTAAAAAPRAAARPAAASGSGAAALLTGRGRGRAQVRRLRPRHLPPG